MITIRDPGDHDAAVSVITMRVLPISINCRGRPLRSYETVVNLISNTTNRGGLVVQARLDRRNYPTGKKVSDREFKTLNIEPGAWHGDWNYVIRPRKNS